eukprot:CAMPEP_0173377874 /NCGR_PEP_ID=MMETSP1356-20130122/1158_1 /TAXON_ID=77927 ORGANISM="Hemiselmis virescens, Strain PCC157" /NCGR_SAMPLE_ID=MMETSP1356 /ASSEMBLY_ACC=CAM_ASM_000847 /LENGTH=87 /DNA_ID=CAMNT_0014330781 /DNA_START=486 /DNA_END=750 /DNA_ORIENTATION=+
MAPQAAVQRQAAGAVVGGGAMVGKDISREYQGTRISRDIPHLGMVGKDIPWGYPGISQDIPGYPRLQNSYPGILPSVGGGGGRSSSA